MVTADARSYLERSNEAFDVIQVNAVDTWAAASGGGFTLSESYLYTVEAFENYFRHLKDDGILQVGRWAFRQPQQLARIVSVAVEAFRRMDVTQYSGHLLRRRRSGLRARGRHPGRGVHQENAIHSGRTEPAPAGIGGRGLRRLVRSGNCRAQCLLGVDLGVGPGPLLRRVPA